MAELEVLEELARSPILPRVWPNPELVTSEGVRLPIPDFWIDEAGIAGQIHSRKYHARDKDWERTVSADSVFAEHGILVLAVTPTGFRRDPAAFRERVERAYLAAIAAGRRPDVRMTSRPSGLLVPASHSAATGAADHVSAGVGEGIASPQQHEARTHGCPHTAGGSRSEGA
jgi:hypothetical protein